MPTRIAPVKRFDVPHPDSKEVISKSSGPRKNIVTIVRDIDEIPSTNNRAASSTSNRTRAKQSRIALEPMSLCCKWSMIGMIVLLFVAIITVIVWLVVLIHNKTNDSTGATDSSQIGSNSVTSTTTIFGGANTTGIGGNSNSSISTTSISTTQFLPTNGSTTTTISISSSGLTSTSTNTGFNSTTTTTATATIATTTPATISTSTTATTTSTATTTTSTSCGSQGSPNLLSVSSAIAWTSYSYNYMATNPAPILSFIVHGGGASETAYLDDVSVVDNSAPSIQLLDNPSFENSTSTVAGWDIWCTSSCITNGDGGQITTSGCHTGSGSNCYKDHCNGGYDFLGQSFSAIVGHNYTISFWLYKTGGGAGKFYANIS